MGPETAKALQTAAPVTSPSIADAYPSAEQIRQPPDCYTEAPGSVLVFVTSSRPHESCPEYRDVQGYVLGARGGDVEAIFGVYGPCVEYWEWLEQLLVEPGAWVWEGKTSYPNGPECDLEARGTLRRPTLSELARVAAGLGPFDTGTISPIGQVPAEYDFSWEDEVT